MRRVECYTNDGDYIELPDDVAAVLDLMEYIVEARMHGNSEDHAEGIKPGDYYCDVYGRDDQGGMIRHFSMNLQTFPEDVVELICEWVRAGCPEG